MKTRAVFCLVGMALPLTACVTLSEVRSEGSGLYSIESEGAIGRTPSQARSRALRAAQSFCQKRGRMAQVRDADTRGLAAVGPVKATLIFSCLEASDPQYRTPELGARPVP